MTAFARISNHPKPFTSQLNQNTMLKLLILIALVLTTICCISQHGYPKKILLEGDTVIVFHSSQIATINWIKDTKDYCCELSDLLHAELLKYEHAISLCDSVIASQQTEIELYGERIMTKNNQISVLVEEGIKKDAHIDRVTNQRNGLFWYSLAATVGNLLQAVF